VDLNFMLHRPPPVNFAVVPVIAGLIAGSQAETVYVHGNNYAAVFNAT
jgi:hypothetical protein